jgi:hypothetical protein
MICVNERSFEWNLCWSDCWLCLVQNLPILPIIQKIRIRLSVQKPTYPTYRSRLLNSSLYLLALFEQLFEASQINNLCPMLKL